VRLAGALALTAGAITPAAGSVGLGFLSDRISLIIRLGYPHAIATSDEWTQWLTNLGLPPYAPIE